MAAFLAPIIAGGSRLLGGLGAVGRNLPGIGNIVKGIGASIPHIENEVIVEIVGQPGARKADLYRLAMATAFGLVGRFDIAIVPGVGAPFVPAPPGLLMCEYDAADNWVRCTLRYRTSTAAAVASFAGDAAEFYRDTAVYSGPDDFVIGGQFNFTSDLAPGIPRSAQSEGLPKLPFANREILNAGSTVTDPDPRIPLGQARKIPSPNPKPPGDNRSRGIAYEDPNPGNLNAQARLIPLVFAALADPGSPALQVFPPPISGPTGG